jgi:hypothetical protein
LPVHVLHGLLQRVGSHNSNLVITERVIFYLEMVDSDAVGPAA